MTETMSLKDAFKLKRDVENYIEKWENTKPEEDPLLKSWTNHIEKNKITIQKKKRRK